MASRSTAWFHATSALAAACLAWSSGAVAADYSVVYTFLCVGGDLCKPGPVVAGPGGHLFGLTTADNGAVNSELYEFDGQAASIVHRFDTGSAGLLTQAGGVLYGVTGLSSEQVWAWDAAGGYRTVFTLPSGSVARLAAAPDGTLYFIHATGRASTSAALARYVPGTGQVSVLHVFPAEEVNFLTWSGLLLQGHRLFGTTTLGPWVYDSLGGRFAEYRAAAGQGNDWASIGFADGALFGTHGVYNLSGYRGFYQFDTAHGFQPFSTTLPYVPAGAKGFMNPAPDGLLYGVLDMASGSCEGAAAGGLVYQLDPVTHAQVDLHDWCAPDDPTDGPVTALDGALYGSVAFGNSTSGYIYRLAP
jgi:hypothetical protein